MFSFFFHHVLLQEQKASKSMKITWNFIVLLPVLLLPIVLTQGTYMLPIVLTQGVACSHSTSMP